MWDLWDFMVYLLEETSCWQFAKWEENGLRYKKWSKGIQFGDYALRRSD